MNLQQQKTRTAKQQVIQNTRSTIRKRRRCRHIRYMHVLQVASSALSSMTFYQFNAKLNKADKRSSTPSIQPMFNGHVFGTTIF